MRFSPGRARGLDSVYLFEWKTGKLKWKNTAESGTYYGGVFLSPEVIMLPNTIAARLELWSTAPEQKAPILMLHLPRLVPGRSIRTITARGEPNPQGTYRKPRRMPFHSSVEDSIVLYADWGPDICRWLNAGGVVMDWITITSGQRCVLLPRQSPSWFIMLDFNPAKVRAHEVLQPEDDPFVDYGIWAEPVVSRLPCHFVRSAAEFERYHGASLDDHRIIATRRNILGRVCEVDIHYFGVLLSPSTNPTHVLAPDPARCTLLPSPPPGAPTGHRHVEESAGASASKPVDHSNGPQCAHCGWRGVELPLPVIARTNPANPACYTVVGFDLFYRAFSPATLFAALLYATLLYCAGFAMLSSNGN
ncbi:hypothetical protein B0H14DRAFT_3484731 [Mycena olivaceomarginata]|nr:hypothetical protein B0H14DRAFT_3484731 [Mycena olivaceomarginata]